MSSPKEAVEPVPKQFKLNEGDWVCSDAHCGNINFARRQRCNRCNKEKGDAVLKKKLGQEIGKALAEKSKGLFTADDWQCSKCGNVNWARRQQCNMCNAPKFGDIEERTGFGGGYNDRGVVEYIKRDDSDNEYDEFGRKKRKLSSTKQGDNSKENSENDGDSEEKEKEKKVEKKQKKVESEESDEGEEDEGDDDLSKYDLSGWGGKKKKVESEDSEDGEEDEDDGDLSKYDLSGWGDESDQQESSKPRSHSPTK